MGGNCGQKLAHLNIVVFVYNMNELQKIQHVVARVKQISNVVWVIL
jgi:hypothetical protein